LFGSKLGKMLLCSAYDKNMVSSIKNQAFDTNKVRFEILETLQYEGFA